MSIIMYNDKHNISQVNAQKKVIEKWVPIQVFCMGTIYWETTKCYR